MPRKINRNQSKIPPATQQSSSGIDVSDGSIMMLGVGMTAQAAATAYAAKANLISTTIHSLAECGTAYLNYAAECQRTRQVQIWSSAVLGEARERTRQIEIQAEAMVTAAERRNSKSRTPVRKPRSSS